MESEFELSIVVPVYNSAETLKELVDRIAALDFKGGHRLILVNDGSDDDSAKICADLAKQATIPVTFVNLMRNFGEHNAVMAGLHHARGAYVVTIDDDFQNPPEEIGKLVAYAIEGDYDVVYSDFADRKYPGWRNFGSWLTNWLSGFFLDKPKGLYLSSFRCMSARVVEAIIGYDGAFPYIDGMILQTTSNIGSLVVEHAERQSGSSGYTLRKLIRLWSNTFINFSIVPLRLSIGIGAILAMLGLLGVVWVIIEHFLLDNPAGWGSLMCALFLFSGTQLIILGIAGEYLGRLFLNANRRPQFVVRETVKTRK